MKYLSGQHNKPQADETIDDKILQIIPPGSEHFLLVSVAQGAHQSRPYGRHGALDVEFSDD